MSGKSKPQTSHWTPPCAWPSIMSKLISWQFTLQLIRRIMNYAESPEQIAEIVVEAVANHYEWDNVLVPARRTGGAAVSGKAACREGVIPPPVGYHHPINQGVTGHVYQTGKSLLVTDVRDPRYERVYLAGFPESRSELCRPVTVRGMVYWLLNAEDSRRNAFAKEEQETLEHILREVAMVLELASQHQIYSELLKCTRDAIIQTDFRGTIKQTNPATETLLGYGEAEMSGTPLNRYFKDKGQAKRVLEAEYVPNDEVRLLHRDGSEVGVWLSGTSLPKEVGLKVYVASDLSTRKRIETLAILRHMYNEIASQIKTPLCLAFTWLGKLQGASVPPEVADVVTKTVQQLQKVELSFDRLLFYERHETVFPSEKVLFDIPPLLEHLKQAMPASEAAKVQVTAAPGIPPVRGNLYQISFCIESLLAFFLRFVPEEGEVKVSVSAHGADVEIAIAGYAPQITGGAVKDYAEVGWAIRAITELAVGEEMMKSFIEKNHDGTFRKEAQEGGCVEYVITLPAA